MHWCSQTASTTHIYRINSDNFSVGRKTLCRGHRLFLGNLFCKAQRKMFKAVRIPSPDTHSADRILFWIQGSSKMKVFYTASEIKAFMRILPLMQPVGGFGKEEAMLLRSFVDL
ncbi:hypothetical protein XENOCAPTIV_027675 [Xenoophorus captivus]|uniref:Uncharacterized protein n=1 Tax=Xenoophorus captivus TaxID=1517983 RepID=A0ABV0RAN1_9TELE